MGGTSRSRKLKGFKSRSKSSQSVQNVPLKPAALSDEQFTSHRERVSFDDDLDSYAVPVIPPDDYRAPTDRSRMFKGSRSDQQCDPRSMAREEYNQVPNCAADNAAGYHTMATEKGSVDGTSSCRTSCLPATTMLDEFLGTCEDTWMACYQVATACVIREDEIGVIGSDTLLHTLKAFPH